MSQGISNASLYCQKGVLNKTEKKKIMCTCCFRSKVSNGHSPQIRRIRANVSNVSSVECIESGEKGWRMSVECSESGLSRVANLANLANF